MDTGSSPSCGAGNQVGGTSRTLQLPTGKLVTASAAATTAGTTTRARNACRAGCRCASSASTRIANGIHKDGRFAGYVVLHANASVHVPGDGDRV